MRYCRTTENNNVANQTGSTYISDSMTDVTIIPTANMGFSTRSSSQKVSSDYNIEWRTKIAIWPPKPEIVIPLELQQIASKFQRQVLDFRPWQARIKCHQVIATMTDNRKWQCGFQNRKYICGTMTDRMTISRANPGFSTMPRTKNWPRAIATTIDNRKWQYRRFGHNLAIFGSRSLSQSFG